MKDSKYGFENQSHKNTTLTGKIVVALEDNGPNQNLRPEVKQPTNGTTVILKTLRTIM